MAFPIDITSSGYLGLLKAVALIVGDSTTTTLFGAMTAIAAALGA